MATPMDIAQPFGHLSRAICSFRRRDSNCPSRRLLAPTAGSATGPQCAHLPGTVRTSTMVLEYPLPTAHVAGDKPGARIYFLRWKGSQLKLDPASTRRVTRRARRVRVIFFIKMNEPGSAASPSQLPFCPPLSLPVQFILMKKK